MPNTEDENFDRIDDIELKIKEKQIEEIKLEIKDNEKQPQTKTFAESIELKNHKDQFREFGKYIAERFNNWLKSNPNARITKVNTENWLSTLDTNEERYVFFFTIEYVEQ